MLDEPAGALVDSAYVAERLGISVGALALRRGKGTSPPFIRFGRTVRYRRETLLAWIADAEAQTASARART